MHHRFLFHRLIPVAACGVAAWLVTSPASAKEGKESKRSVCTASLAAYKSALEQESQGHMREARASFQTCSETAACSFAPKCKAKYEKLLSEMPTVVPVVTDGGGAPHCDVQVNMDGQPFTSHLDGKALPVEVGLHEFTFATAKGVFATEKVLVLEGQRNREISVVIGGPKPGPTSNATGTSDPSAPADSSASPEAPAAVADNKQESTPNDAKPASSSPPEAPVATRPGSRGILPYLVGGVGVLGVGAGAALTIWGQKDNSALSSCSPQCPQSSVDHIRTMYTLADVSFGVGVAGLAVGAFLFLRTPSGEAPPQPHATALHFDVAPTRSGGLATVRGEF